MGARPMRRPIRMTIRRIAKNVMQGQSGADCRAMEDQGAAEAQRTQRERRGEGRVGGRENRRMGEGGTRINSPCLLVFLSPCLSPSPRSLCVLCASAVKSALFFSREPIRISGPAMIFALAILTSPPFAIAQFRTTSRQVSETQESQANQLPLSGRSGQMGSVTATQNPTPGATTSVNTINPAIQTQGPFSGSVWGAARAPFSGRLSLREAVGRGIDFNLGAVGLTNAVSESRAQRKIVRSALLPSISGYLSETVDRKSVVEGN